MEQAKLLIIFATVLKYGSMNAAAPHLRMTPSAVSQHIRKLEAYYQIKLLNRTTRKLMPTEAGKALWQYAEQLMHLLEQAESDIQNLRAEPVGEVRITMPTTYSKLRVMQRTIAQIRLRFPKIRLVLLESDYVVDLLAENAPDIAIRVVPQANETDFIARPLATWQTWLCASPTYLAENPIEKTPDLLTAHWLNFHSGVLLSTLEMLELPKQLPENRTDCLGNASTAKDLALLGLGITLLNEGDIVKELANGSLVTVLPEKKLQTRTIYAVTANRTQSAKIQAVLSVLQECFKEFAKT